MRDSMYDDTTAKLTLATALRTNGTVNGTSVDSAGNANFFRAAMLVVVGGTITDGTHAVTLQDSDDNSAFADVPSDLVQGALVGVATGSVQRQAYLGNKRYLRAKVVTSGATAGGTTTAVILLAQGSGAPVT